MSGVALAGGRDAPTDRLAAALPECRRVGPSEDLDAALQGVGTFVYFAAARGDRWGLPDPDDAARAVAAAVPSVGHVVLVSSAAVGEPSHHHLGLLPEDRPAARRTGNSLPERWLELERRVRAAAGTATLTVLRPTALVSPGGKDFFSRFFRRPLAFTAAGYDPTLQLLSPDDLAAAVARVVESPGEGGVYNVAPAAAIPLRKALWAAGTLRLPLPVTLQRACRKVLAPLGLAAPAELLEYVRYPWTVSDAALRQRGYEPRCSSWRAVREMRGAAAEEPEPSFDDFGLDEHYFARLARTLFRFLHDLYWRIEVRGLEHVPRHGPAVLTGMHRGFMPWDGVMLVHLVRRELGRVPRFLIHPALVKHPVLAPYMIKLGGILASQENADWVLARDDLLAVFPEGIRGAFRMYRDVYKLGKLGRDEYVRMALRRGAPIVPFVTVGSAEIFPIFGKIRWRWWKRYSEWPFLPITPTMGLAPLPSKWHTRFLEPLHVEQQYPPEAAEDKTVVGAISREVRSRMEAAIAEMLRRRRRVFWGSIFEERGVLEEKAA